MRGASDMKRRENKCVQSFGTENQGKPIGRPRCGWEDNIKIDLN